MEELEVNICYCCKSEKEGSWIDCNGEKRFCCFTCNHLKEK